MSDPSPLTTDQHTSGPWTPDDRDSADQYRYVLDNGGGTICRIRRGFHRPIEEDEANARLIAAAPDLLTLAQQYAAECAQCAGSGKVEMLSASGHPAGKVDCEDCADIRAVIAKAEGKEHV